MVDKNIRTDYSKLKMFVRLDKATGSTERMSTLQEIEAKAQLCRYAQDKVAQRLAAPTTMHLILLQFKGSDVVACEEI
jgi:hypothetical protein